MFQRKQILKVTSQINDKDNKDMKIVFSCFINQVLVQKNERRKYVVYGIFPDSSSWT